MSLLYDWILPFLVRNHRKPQRLNTMEITEDHWLKDAIRMPIAGGSSMNIRRFLVIHNTSGWSARSSIEGWMEAANGVLAHLIIDRDGTIYQCRPFNKTCGHAGESKWRDPNTGSLYVGLNSCSIGIELANAADMTRNPDIYPSYLMGDLAGKAIPRVRATHKNGGSERPWEVYPQAQLDACARASKALVERYKLDDCIGHDDIAPRRKVDPGPAFPIQVLRNGLGFLREIPKLR